jgi:hypothetical protein
MHSSTHSLTSALDGGEWPASRPSRITPRERFPSTHGIRGWVGPRAGRYMVVKVKAKLSLCLTKHHAMKAYWGSGGIAPRIPDLGTRWRWVVSFTPRQLYPQEKIEREIQSPTPGIETRSSDCPAGSQSLYQMSYPGSERRVKGINVRECKLLVKLMCCTFSVL